MHNDHNEKIENPFSNSSCVVCIGPEIHWICWKTFNDNLVNENPHAQGYYTSLGLVKPLAIKDHGSPNSGHRREGEPCKVPSPSQK